MIIRALIGIPTYNNPTTISAVVRGCLEHSPLPVLVIDDGSDQPVKDILERDGFDLTSGRIQVLRWEKNLGKGVALARAFEWGVKQNFTHLLAFDGDGQHQPSCIPSLTEELKLKPWDLIIGVREMDSPHVPASSKFGRKFSNFWVKYQTGLKIQDSQSGLRVYPLFHVQNMKFRCHRYDFEIEVLIRLLWKKVAFSEVKVPVYYPPAAERVSHFRKFKDNFRISILNTLFVILSLFRQEQSPSKMSLALALGVFIGTTPLFGFHAPLALTVALLFRLSPLLLILGTQISIPPLIPFLIFGSLTFGNLLVGKPLPSMSAVPNLTTAALFFKEWFLGSLILGFLLGVFVYIVCRIVGVRFSRPGRGGWSGKSRGGVFGNWLLKWIVLHVGLKSAYFCLYLIVPYFYLFAPRARRASLEYWEITQPHLAPFKRRMQVLKHFYAFGTVLLDRLYLSHHPSASFKKLSSGFENLEQASQKGGILLGAHIGGWEIAMRTLVKDQKQSAFIFSQYRPDKKQASPHDSTLYVNDMGLPIIALYSLLRDGKVIALMGDRPLENQYELIPFFGKLAIFDATAFRMAEICNVPLFVSFGFKKDCETYQFMAFPLGKGSMRDYVELIERELIKSPDQWFNFYPFWSSQPASPIALKSKKAQHHLTEELNKPPLSLPAVVSGLKTTGESGFPS